MPFLNLSFLIYFLFTSVVLRSDRLRIIHWIFAFIGLFFFVSQMCKKINLYLKSIRIQINSTYWSKMFFFRTWMIQKRLSKISYLSSYILLTLKNDWENDDLEQKSLILSSNFWLDWKKTINLAAVDVRRLFKCS